MPDYASSSYGSPFRSAVTPWVRRLLIANTAVFGVTLVLALLRVPSLQVFDWLGLNPARLLFRPWTVVTYAFVHAGVFHWFFNMIGLFFFGPRLEEQWGSREFIRFYLIAALGGALFSLITLFGPSGPVVGASAAINGLLMAWALYWPDDEVLFLGIIPVRMKWLVIAFAFFSMFSAMSVQSDGVAHLAHLGGFVIALLYLKSPWGPTQWGPAVRTGAQKRKRRLTFGWGRKKPAASTMPTTPTPQKPVPVRKPSRDEQQLLDDVDRILEKISARGLSSLTEDERKRLDEVSRRYRSN